MAQLPSQSQFGDYGEWPGRDVLDSGGERLGDVREIYLDRETGRPEWVLVDVDGDQARFVPLADAAVESSAIRVAHPGTVIRNGPSIGPEPRIDESQERRLYEHYGLGYSADESDSGLPAPEPTGWGAPDAPVSSWSSAAEPTNDAPPAADPPSPVELAEADIPEPPAAAGPDDVTMPFDSLGASTPAAADPYVPPVIENPSPLEATTSEDLPTPFSPTPSADAEPPTPTPSADAEPFTPTPSAEAEPATPFSPTPLPEVEAPVAPPTPPSAVEPEPVTPSPPAAPAAAAPRPASSPPPRPEEPSGGPLALLKSPRGAIAVGVAVLLILIIRRLR